MFCLVIIFCLLVLFVYLFACFVIKMCVPFVKVKVLQLLSRRRSIMPPVFASHLQSATSHQPCLALQSPQCQVFVAIYLETYCTHHINIKYCTFNNGHLRGNVIKVGNSVRLMKLPKVMSNRIQCHQSAKDDFVP